VDQQQLSATQFGARANSYLSSTVHAQGADLDRLEKIARETQPVRALDVGCGAGHASFALARGGTRHVVAYDPSPDMLGVVAQEARARGLAALETRSGAAEVLPFDEGCFDLVVTRFSAHHWASVPRALAECARVLKAGGKLVVIDVIAPEPPLLDTALQVVEFLRDGSHVRDYRVSEWAAMQKAVGFAEPSVSSWKLPMEFGSWIARIGTPAPRVAALEAVFAGLPQEVRDYFRISADLSFAIDSAWMETTKISAEV
jgi:ubiquinone/menaquinone biosynthesis C-methylase UbiE